MQFEANDFFFFFSGKDGIVLTGYLVCTGCCAMAVEDGLAAALYYFDDVVCIDIHLCSIAEAAEVDYAGVILVDIWSF